MGANGFGDGQQGGQQIGVNNLNDNGMGPARRGNAGGIFSGGAGDDRNGFGGFGSAIGADNSFPMRNFGGQL